MSRFAKLQTEAKPAPETPNGLRLSPGPLLLLGTAATLISPVVQAEDLFEEASFASDLLVAPALSVVSKPTAEPRSEPSYVAVESAVLVSDTRSAVEEAQVVFINDSFYRFDEAPPANHNTQAQAPSRIDEFNKRASQIITIELGATLNGQQLGPMIVETTLTEVVAIDAQQLQDALNPVVDETTVLLLSQFDSGFISVDQLDAIDVVARLDPATLTLSINAPLKSTGPLEFSLSPEAAPAGTETASPARFAGGLTSTFLVNQSFGDNDNVIVSSALSGFLNAGGVRGLNLDFGGNLVLDDGNGETRYDADRTILFMDRPERALRFEAGTLFQSISEIGGEADFLGIGVTKSYRALQPTRALRSRGRRSFELDRPSEVTVLVDGQVVSRFEAPAGPINLNNIPLANLSNQVAIVVEDEFGRRQIENFSIAADILLLDEGLSEYSFGIGQNRDRSDTGFSYEDSVIAAGNYQFGVSSNLTLGAFGYASETGGVVGAQTVVGALSGIAQVELSYSDNDDIGGGGAASVNYRWDSSPSARTAQNFALAVDYREEAYSPAGSTFASTTKFDVSAFYERQISDSVRINLSGNYSEDYTASTAENVSLGSSFQFRRFLLGAGVRYSSRTGRDDEVGAFFSLTRRFGRRASLNARYDTQNERGTLRFARPSRNEVGSVGFESELARREQDLALRGAADYTANRFRSRLSVTQVGAEDTLDGDTNVSARFQTGLAFADGKFGIGRDPGLGFVMVERHNSLEGAQVQIKSRGRQGIRAESGTFGPAVSRISSPFVPITTRVDVANAPIGYNVGEGAYYSVPGARSAIKITVGSDAFRSAVATFIVEGEPLSLVAARLVNTDTGASQVTFTNRAGRALLSDLEPGPYRLEFTGTDYRFDFVVDTNSDTFINLGQIDLTAKDTP